jgi:hypothetical protein
VFTSEQVKELSASLAVQLQWPEIMDIKTAGRYMDRSPKAVRHLIDDGKLRVTCIDGKKQLRRRDIDEVFEAGLL